MPTHNIASHVVLCCGDWLCVGWLSTVPIQSVMMTVRVTKHVSESGEKYYLINDEDRAAAEEDFRQYKAPPTRTSGRKQGEAAAGADDPSAGPGGPERVAVNRGPNKRATTTYLRSAPQGRG